MDSLNVNHDINFIVWTDNLDDGAKIAKSITGSNNALCDYNTISNFINNTNVNVFLRGPLILKSRYPKNNVADCIIVNTKEQNDTVSMYLEDRKNVPLKIVVSENDLNAFADEKGARYITNLNNNYANKLINEVIEIDSVIKKAFDLIDTDKNSHISKDELIALSKNLNHDLSKENANEIVSLLSNGLTTINYNQFKQWWYMGKTNFVFFRHLIKTEIAVKDLIKKNSQQISTYLENLSNEIEKLTLEEENSCNTNIIIKPKNDFENGIGISLSSSLGAEGKTLINTYPNYAKINPLTLRLELQIDSPENACEVIDSLKNLLDGLKEMITELKQAMEIGLNILFKHSGNSIYIDVTLSGYLADILKNQYPQIEEALTNFSEYYKAFGEVKFISGLKLDNIFEITLDELLNDISNFKLEANAYHTNIKSFLAVINSFATITNVYNKRAALLFKIILNILQTFKFTKMSSEYDNKELLNVMKDMLKFYGMTYSSEEEAGPEPLQKLEEYLSQFQYAIREQVEGFKEIILATLEPFLNSLKYISFDRISITLLLPLANIHYNPTIYLTGFTKLFRDNILNKE